jgi:hypothetical protein
VPQIDSSQAVRPRRRNTLALRLLLRVDDESDRARPGVSTCSIPMCPGPICTVAAHKTVDRNFTPSRAACGTAWRSSPIRLAPDGGFRGAAGFEGPVWVLPRHMVSSEHVMTCSSTRAQRISHRPRANSVTATQLQRPGRSHVRMAGCTWRASLTSRMVTYPTAILERPGRSQRLPAPGLQCQLRYQRRMRAPCRRRRTPAEGPNARREGEALWERAAAVGGSTRWRRFSL